MKTRQSEQTTENGNSWTLMLTKNLNNQMDESWMHPSFLELKNPSISDRTGERKKKRKIESKEREKGSKRECKRGFELLFCLSSKSQVEKERK